MTWSKKSKVQQSGGDEEIRTPDGQQILVGAAEDQVLLYQIAFNNWLLKSKTAQAGWGLKVKIKGIGKVKSQSIEPGTGFKKNQVITLELS